ncbi:hypothetical protein BC962_0507 [Gillisia mitskevichiae]|uniref:DUF5602 domain-containing protein n=1 Tax=Gillisia mitskevichiae TaxID=270921 RepID=A0A495PYM3_9FLAO|nr:hypothetical protein [Gillisia mitskevichiae]RKS55543.1 hypothetical protein BC962_0507 [Gillisia mitskevichiae]
MKKFKTFKLSPQSLSPLLYLLLLLIFISCETDQVSEEASQSLTSNNSKAPNSSGKMNTFYGPAKQMGDGVLKSMVVMKHDGTPEAIGLRISEKVLTGLPHEELNITLDLSSKMKGMAFDHIDFGWNPHGHEPPGIYDIPHFDIHFYMVSVDYKNTILDPALIETPPDAKYIPEGYFTPGGLVPYMGEHWLDLNAAELQPGGVFTRTFIYGSYDQEFIFYEPMITLAYLQQKGKEQIAIPQPAEFQRTGLYYPTTYSINYDAVKKEYLITLENLVLR